MRMLEAIETQMPQDGQNVLTPFDPSIGDVNQAAMAIPEASPSANIFDSAAHLGHGALSYLRDRITFPGTLSRSLAVGLAAVSGYGLAASRAVAHNTRPISPASTILPIETYYSTLLGPSNSVNPLRVQNLELSANRLTFSGPCTYDSNGIPISAVKSVDDTHAGQSVTYCASKPGGHTTHFFVPRDKLISNPSMNFQPILLKIGEQAANSVSLPPTGHGTPTQINISINPQSHSGEADVFYGNTQTTASTKQVKELKFLTHNHQETVRKVLY
jgi:hypothetical protein